MASSIRFDFLSSGAAKLSAEFRNTGDSAAAASRGAKVLQDVIGKLGQKENRTAAESANLAKALRLTGDAEDRAAAKALAADIAIRRLGDSLQDSSRQAGGARGGFAALAGEVTGFGAAAGAASSEGSTFSRVLAGINLATGVAEPALAGLVVAAGGIAAAFTAAAAGAAAYQVALAPLLSQTADVTKAQETLDKARATAQANYAAAIKAGGSAKTADTARTRAMTAAQEKYNQAVQGTPAPVRAFAKQVADAKNTWQSWADSLARPVLAPLSGMLKLVSPALKAITPLVKVAAGAFGTLVTELSAKVGAGGLTSVVNTLLPHVRTAILDLGHAAGNVAAGIWGILKAFLPVSGQMTGGIVKLTALFKNWANSLPEHSGFQSLMTMFREQTPKAMEILRNLGTVLLNVGKAMTGISTFSNSQMLLNTLLPLSGVMASLSRNTDLVRVALYALAAVKIGQQFAWVNDAWKGIVRFAAAAEGATVAETIAAAATRAWGMATAALPWVALAAAVVAVAVLIIKYHSQIWAFMRRVWNDILGVIMTCWHWVQANWPLLLAILTGPVGLAIRWVVQNFGQITGAVKTVLAAVSSTWNTVWNTLKGAFRTFVVDGILGPLGLIVHGAAAAFGWVPGLGSKLQGAAKAFDTFKANVNSALGGINGRTVNVSVAMTAAANPYPGGISGRAAAGMYVSRGRPGVDDQLILAQRGEVIVPTRLVRAGAVDHLRGQIPGFAAGGVAGGVSVKASAPSYDTVTGRLQASVEKLAVAFAKANLAGNGGIVADALSWLGKIPYVWGGTAVPGGADCSGFVQTIYGRHRISAPRTSEAQGGWVRRSGPVPGGLAFYHSPAGGADPGHVAIVRNSSTVISQGGGMGPTLMGLNAMPLLWTGVPPAGFARGGVVMDRGGWLRTGWNPPVWNGTGQPELVTPGDGLTGMLGQLTQILAAIRQLTAVASPPGGGFGLTRDQLGLAPPAAASTGGTSGGGGDVSGGGDTSGGDTGTGTTTTAPPPKKPARPNPAQKSAIAVLAGLMGGLIRRNQLGEARQANALLDWLGTRTYDSRLSQIGRLDTLLLAYRKKKNTKAAKAAEQLLGTLGVRDLTPHLTAKGNTPRTLAVAALTALIHANIAGNNLTGARQANAILTHLGVGKFTGDIAQIAWLDGLLAKYKKAKNKKGIAATETLLRQYGVRKFDAGGWLPTGLSVTYNGTGQPEQVLPPGGQDALVAELRALRAEVRQLTGVTAAVPAATGRHVTAGIGGTGADAAFRRRYPGR